MNPLSTLAIVTTFATVLASCCAPCPPGPREPGLQHAVAEISLVITVNPESQATFDRLLPPDRNRVVETAWAEVHRLLPREVFADLGPHRVDLDPDGRPSRVALDALATAFQGHGGFATDPPKGCEWDEHDSRPLDGDGPRLGTVSTLKCRWDLPVNVLAKFDPNVPVLRFDLSYAIHSWYLREVPAR